MTVEELFEKEGIDHDFISNNFEGDYWEKCDKFILEKWNDDIDSMTQRQANWVSRILEDCVEKKIESRRSGAV